MGSDLSFLSKDKCTVIGVIVCKIFLEYFHNQLYKFFNTHVLKSS